MVEFAKYELKRNGTITKDGNTMHYEDIVKDLNRKSFLEKDKERLDWLADPSNVIGNITLPKVCVENNTTSLRDAIDDAMKSKFIICSKCNTLNSALIDYCENCDECFIGV